MTQRERPRIIGHRGAPALRPEHSPSAYRLAMAAGAAFVEPDVVPSRDGVLVVRHDLVLDDTTDVLDHPALASRRREVEVDGERLSGVLACDLDWAETRTLRSRERLPAVRPQSAAHDDTEGVLRLRDLVDLVDEADGATSLVIELKHPEFAASIGHDLVDALVRELEGRWDRSSMRDVVFESFSWPILRRLRERGLPGALVALVDGDGETGAQAEAAEDTLLDELATWADGVSVSDRRLGFGDDHARGARGRRLVAAAHERGLAVYVWTLRSEDEYLPAAYAGRADDYARDVAATGVDAVFADDPGRVRAALG